MAHLNVKQKYYPHSTSLPRTITNTVGVRSASTLDVNLKEYNDDAFGRLRTSNPYTLFDFTSIYGKEPLLFDELITGSGTATHSAESYISMAVTGNGDSVIRQTREYIPYQPGKSRLVYLTGQLINSLSTADIVSRMGSFDTSMGYFLESSGGTVSIVERNETQERRIPQSQWLDPLDGTGSSRVTIDFTDAQILFLDQEWLGVGQVRAGIVAKGEFLTIYRFEHNGADGVKAPYFRMAKLPLRYEITSTGGAGSMRMICGTVLSEGGYSDMGRKVSTKTYSNVPDIDIADGEVPIWSVRLRPDSGTIPYRNATIKMRGIELLSTSNNNRDIIWRFRWNPETLTGTFVNYDDTYSVAQICKHSVKGTGTSFNTVSGGVILNSGFIPAGGSTQISNTIDELVNSIPIGRTIQGESDVISLTIQTVRDNASLEAMMYWAEIR